LAEKSVHAGGKFIVLAYAYTLVLQKEAGDFIVEQTLLQSGGLEVRNSEISGATQ
jgi:hypothetical protein